MSAEPFTVRVEGPSPAMAVALDLARRSLWLLPVLLIVSALFWGFDGVLSTAYGLAIVVANFVLAAYLLAVTGRINAALMAGAAMFGFLLRLALIFGAVLLVRDASWVELVPLGATLIGAHLALLFWEMRYVSGALAFSGLRPGATPNPYLPDSARSSSMPTPSSTQTSSTNSPHAP